MRKITVCAVLTTMVVVVWRHLTSKSGAYSAQQESGLAAWYRFDRAEALGNDASDGGRLGAVSKATCGEGREGGGLVLEGRGGMEVKDTRELRSAQGFTLECWVRFSSVSDNMNLISKDGEYLLRLDPPAEGCNLSFFTNVGGSLEPRVRGITPVPGVWCHVIATWDGQYATLRINGQQFRMRRAGPLPATDAPVLIGLPCKWAPVGLKGTVDEVKLYSRALADSEVIMAEYDFGPVMEGPAWNDPRFEFGKGTQGFEAWHADHFRAAKGRLQAVVHGHGSALLHRNLRVPIADKQFVSLRMAVTGGRRGRLVFCTSRGAGEVFFPLKADGKMHSYVLRLDDQPEWNGTLTALGVSPSEGDAEVALEFVRISKDPEAPAEIMVKSFLPDKAINRAGRPCRVAATVNNTGGTGRNLVATLVPWAGVKVLGPAKQTIPRIEYLEPRQLLWNVRSPAPGEARLEVSVTGDDLVPATSTLSVAFTPPVALPKAPYVPEPKAVSTGNLLVGAHYCPLWKQGSRSTGWELIVPYPEREPALGWYDEDNPEVTDWEIKWALEHGVSFFVYCWYRRSQGRPVEMFLEHAIHDGLFHARCGGRLKFCIMWENQSRGTAGVASEDDLLSNLLPFWIKTYFKHPSYLRVDNKPLLFIYRPEFLVDDLGGVANVRRALEKTREACRTAGFEGLTILGEYRGTDPAPLKLMAEEGLDYSFAYCWHVSNNPSPEQAIRAQEAYWQRWMQLGILPHLLTVSMGWDSTPWHPSHSIWRLPPDEFETLCRRAKGAMAAMPATSLGNKMVLLDNWNEFGEGHYIAPHRQYGFGYLDAVRAAFTDAPPAHTDLVPEDVGLGPYDRGYRKYADLMSLCTKRAVAEEGLTPKLVAWWTFDEPDDSLCALDYTGNGQGGFVKDAERVPGLRGRALSCHGGSVTIPPRVLCCPLREITVECWVKTETAGQSDKWFVNNVYGNGESGFRLGLSEGRLCWAIPKTSWSHHLVAHEALPLRAWVHVAATYDGEVMRLYMSGRECGSLKRGGRINPPDSHTCLGSYDTDHKAFFSGLLDEVRIHARALTPEEVRAWVKP